MDLILKRFGLSPARLLGLRSVELVGTCLGALAVLVFPLTVMVVLLPRLIEPDPALPPSMPVQVTVLPLLVSVLVAAAVTVVAALVAARRSASINPGEVLRDDA
jgi:ABC-type antimicrobial peptide transport system permease subunit